MKKVDRLGWTAGMSFEAYGTRFGIRVNDSAVLDQVPDYLPLGWEPDPDVEPEPIVDYLYSLKVGGPTKRKGLRRYNLLYAGAGRLARSMDMGEVFASLNDHLQHVTAYLAKDYLFVHAGVVGWQGRAIVIPGRSFCGKSGLVSALVQAGASYYSDEYAIFDSEGWVHPYPRPVTFQDEDGNIEKEYTLEDLGGTAGEEPIPVGAVVMTEYQPGASWRPRYLTPSRAMLALMDNTIAARRDPQFSLPVLKNVVTGATAVKSKRGEAETIVQPVLSMALN